MSKDEILEILPTPDSEIFKNLRENSPYNIMLEYSYAINEKYNKKISATVTESSIIEDKNSHGTELNYAFYINAPIGRGYFYKLFEVKLEKDAQYPVSVKAFEKQTKNFGKAETADHFNSILIKIFKSRFTSNLILNLLVQVDFYNEV